RPAAGWAVVPVQTNGLRATGAEFDPLGERYTVTPNAAWPKFTAFPPVPTWVRFTEAADGPAYLTDFVVGTKPGRPRPFAVVLTGSRAGKAELTAPPGVTITGPTPTGDGPLWSVVVPSDVPGPVRFTLSAALPTGPDARWPTPVVWFGPTPVAPRRRPGADRIAVPKSPTEEVPGKPAEPAVAPVSPGKPALDRFPVIDWLPAVGWGLGLLAVVRAAGWGGTRWWPERLVGVGLLGATAAGAGSPWVIVFAVLAMAGAAVRLGSLARRVGAVVLR
ncbi:MAG: hypothetical protein ACRC7O_05785, partial [Fimbriiglobus sp.]